LNGSRAAASIFFAALVMCPPSLVVDEARDYRRAVSDAARQSPRPPLPAE
jgi:hypothetical protein